MRIILFVVCISAGTFSGSCQERRYGSRHRMTIGRLTHSIEFTQKNSNNCSVLWAQDQPGASEGSWWKITGYQFILYNMTQRHSGHYVLRDKNQMPLSTETIEVVANKQNLTLNEGEELRVTFNLEPFSCNIYYTQSSERSQLVRFGNPQLNANLSKCFGLELIKPCGILNKAVKESCSGQYEVRDEKGNLALVVSVEVESPFLNGNYFISGGVFFLTTLLSCCIKTYCCSKDSCRKAPSEDDAAEKKHHKKHISDHRGFVTIHSDDSPDEPLEKVEAVQPYKLQTEPLIHDPPTLSLSAYSQSLLAPPVGPLGQDQSCRFELKGMSSDALLSSDFCPVYSSDKVSFL